MVNWNEKADKPKPKFWEKKPHEVRQNKKIKHLGGSLNPASGALDGAKGDRELDGNFKIEQKCVHEDSPICIGMGRFCKASDISSGDSVLAGDGKLHNVNKVWRKKYSGDMLNIVCFGDNRDDIYVTPEHRYFAIKTNRCSVVTSKDTICKPSCLRKNTEGCNMFFNSYTPDFFEARELRRGDYICLPREHFSTKNNSSIDIGEFCVPFDEEILRIFGHYVAEGCCSKTSNHVSFTTGESEVEIRDFVKNFFNNIGIHVYQRKNKNSKGVSVQQIICNESFNLFLCDNFGRISRFKSIPNFMYYLSPELKFSFINQYLDGDGCISRSSYQCTSVSKKLLLQLRSLLFSVGVVSSIGIHSKKNSSWQLRIYPNDAQILDGFCRDSSSRSKRYWFDDNYVWLPIQDIVTTSFKDVYVYNFEVDSCHSYILNGITHNSTDKKSFSIKAAHLEKIHSEARQQNKEAALLFSFLEVEGYTPTDWIAIPLDLFKEIYDYLKDSGYEF